MKLILMLWCAGAWCSGATQTLTPAWVELGPNGSALVRMVVDTEASCPDLRADGHPLPTQMRTPVPEGLKPVCQAMVPAGTKHLAFGKQRLRLPQTPARVIAIGDTGCRIKLGQIQACSDPNLWPFARVADQVAKLKPDLIVHVGDYLYRETACPTVVEGCAGPHGDNWDTWNADFFEPVRSALPAAPWIFARGNHESCERSFRGWFYYLDPRPFDAGACAQYTEPYIARSGDLRIGVLDTGSTKDQPHAEPAQIPVYAKQLSTLSGQADWIVDHHPFWGYTANPHGLTPSDLTLGPAWADAKPEGIKLVLSGHVHLFEFLALEGGRPNQIIAGDSGTQLDPGFTVDTSGASIRRAPVSTGEVNLSFGLTELQRRKTDWQVILRNAAGTAVLECEMPEAGKASCAKAGRP